MSAASPPPADLDAGQLPVDRSWFLDVNHLARSTPWLHGAVLAYASYGVVLFALLLLAGWWAARRRRDTAAVAAALWAPVGMLIAVALNQPLGASVAERRPYDVLPHVLVLASLVHRLLVPELRRGDGGRRGRRGAGRGPPLGTRRGRGGPADGVRAGLRRAHFPGDVLAGLAFGAAVTLLGLLLVRRPLRLLVERLAGTRLRVLLVAGRRPAEGRLRRRRR